MLKNLSILLAATALFSTTVMADDKTMTDKAKEMGHNAAVSAHDMKEAAKDKVQEIGHKAADKMEAAKDKAIELKDKATDKVSDMMHSKALDVEISNTSAMINAHDVFVNATFKNSSTNNIAISKVTAHEVANEAIIQDTVSGVKNIHNLSIPAGSELKLQDIKHRIKLTKLKAPVKVGQVIELQVQFDDNSMKNFEAIIAK